MIFYDSLCPNIEVMLLLTELSCRVLFIFSIVATVTSWTHKVGIIGPGLKCVSF